jgi:nicotinic acid mononucleotide adenylyltransferase
MSNFATDKDGPLSPEFAIRQLHEAGKKFYITATGGGTSFLGDFLKVPGGSKCIIGGRITYAMESTDDFVGGKLDKYADGMAARRLAVASYEYCLKLNVPSEQSVGIGVACSLAKDNERPGRQHVVNIAIHTEEFTFCLEFTPLPTDSTRVKEEEAVNVAILHMMTMLFVVKVGLHSLCFAYDSVTEMNAKATYNTSPFVVHRDVKCVQDVYFTRGKRDCLANSLSEIAIFPGSYNPLHNGHIEIKSEAERILGMPVYFELTPVNSYKPSIDNIELMGRTGQFDESILLTRAARFVDKIRVLKSQFPHLTKIIIIVGADTWHRVYDDAAHKNGDIEFFENNNVRFLVFGRGMQVKYQDSPLFIKHERALGFDNPVSSTALRKKL